MGLFGSAGDFFGGVMGDQTAFRDTPNLQHAELDPYTKQILAQRVAEGLAPSSQTEGQIVAGKERGMGTPSSLLQAGNVSSPMGDAIMNRQKEQFNNQLGQTHSADVLNAPMDRFSRMSGTIGSAMANAKSALDFAQKQRLADQNETFARNNAINSILKTGGAAIGSIVGQAGIGEAIGGTASDTMGPRGNLSYLGE